jgi:ABC-type Mn2+/Zn2+ transport system ATPase subunit
MNAEVFMSKSGGERGRINLAGVLAIHHLINLSTEGRGINFIGLDETFNGIDSEGQESIIKILESIGITVLMITQNVSNEFNNNNKLLVIKEDGVSRFN